MRSEKDDPGTVAVDLDPVDVVSQEEIRPRKRAVIHCIVSCLKSSVLKLPTFTPDSVNLTLLGYETLGTFPTVAPWVTR